MELENRYDELLVRYLLNETSKEEDQFVLNWTNAQESNRQYLKLLQDTLKLVQIKQFSENLNVDQEWLHFQKAKGKNTRVDFPVIHKEGRPDEEGLRAVGLPGKPRIYKFVIAGAIAASVIFALIITAYLLGSGNNTDAPQISHNEPRVAKQDALAAITLFEQNNTDKIKNIVLPDHSTVVLFPKSELTYTEPVDRISREVHLKGKADFKVAKNKSKPFSVASGAISTTALGTRFTVITDLGAKKVYVQLQEGKVVVKSRKVPATMKDVYLVPGQELIYDAIKETAIVRSFDSQNPSGRKPAPADQLTVDNPSLPKYGKRAWFMFNNQPLNEIFDVLEGMYNVKISYSKMEIQKMYFIGTFNKTESIEKILHEITVVNNLALTKTNNGFTVAKKETKAKK